MCRGLLVFIFCFTLFQVTAQKRVNPTPEDVALAKKLKLGFEDEDIIILSKEVSIRFQKNRKTNLVEVIQDETTQLMGISSSARTQHAVFYDSESEVALFELKDRRGKKVMSRINDEVIKRDDIFHADYRVKYSNVSFPLQGYQYHIKTQKKYNDIKYFTNEYFIDTYRIQKGTITIYIPEWLQIDFIDFNFDGYNIVKEENKTEQGRKITYTLNEIPPQSKEEQTPGPSYMYPHILVQAKSFKNKNEDVTLFNHVSDLYAWYNGLIESVDIDHTAYEGKVAELLEGATSDEEKIKRIYYWVQDNIRYIAFEDGIAGFKPDSPQNVFNKLYGDCKGMALLTKSMLEVAGFDARLVWIGTDRLAYDYSTPSLSVDNHMICSVMLNDKPIFLDGTEKYNRFGEYASRIQNKQALMQDKDSYALLTIPETKDNNIDAINYQLEIEGETLLGSASRSFEGECRVAFQNSLLSFGTDEQEDVLSKYLMSGNSNCMISDIVPFDTEVREEKLQVDYNISITNAISEFDGILYIDLDPVKNITDVLFKDRKSDYKFYYKKEKTTTIELQIPSGYTLESLPENLSETNDLFSIEVTYKEVDSKIVYTKKVELKSRLLQVEDFRQWNDSFSKLKDNLSEQITLAKK